MRIITTGTGYFKAGLKGKITAGGERDVFLGPRGHEQKFTIPEFTIELDGGGKREGCQYGRDFRFDPDGEPVRAGYSREQLSAAFDLVKDKGNWKNPIDALVDPGADLKAIAEATIFFAGSPADFVTVKRGGVEKVRVRAAGYYACIGA